MSVVRSIGKKMQRISGPNALAVKGRPTQVYGHTHVRLDCRFLAEGLHRALSKLISMLRRGDPNGAAAGDLTLAQLSILVTLLDQGPIRMTDLAAHERVRTPTTTVAIRRLEKIGLVKRSRDPSDLRAVLVDITPQGRAVHGESLANRRAALAALLSQLPRSDLETLRKALAPLERLASGEPASGPASNSPARKRA